MTEVVLRRLLHLLKHHGRDFRRGVLLALNLDHGQIVLPGHYRIRHPAGLLRNFVHPAAHEPLDGKDRVLGIGDGLPLRHLPHQTLAIFGEGHYRRRGPTSLGVRDHHRVPTLHDRHDRVGGP